MSAETQTFIAGFVVAITATIFFIRLSRPGKKASCAKSGCGCGKPKPKPKRGGRRG